MRTAIRNLHLKYVDDLTLLESMNLRDALTVNPQQTLVRPLNFHQRTEHTLKPGHSQVQGQLLLLENYAADNKMKINQAKTKLMLFNTAKLLDFEPDVVVNNETVELVEEMKLLGVVVTCDLKWHENTKLITKKAFSRIWMLRRLKNMGASRQVLLDVYCKLVRSVVEFAAAVWNSGITKENSIHIERVQKSALAVILGRDYSSYEEACATLDIETLSNRREQLCYSFALKSSKHIEYKHWFVKNQNHMNTRSQKPCFKPAQARTQRFQSSPIPYMTHLLNTKTS